VAQVLLDAGYESARPLLGGFKAWKDAGMPVEPKRG
jgi:rhodanese-related sulfurtransferase